MVGLARMDETTSTTDSPQVIALPPVVYLAGLAAGAALHWFMPLALGSGKFGMPLGVALIAISIVLVATAVRTFVKAGTNIDVRKPATRVVGNGPFRFTRNPIYLSMTLLVAGIAVWADALWIIITLAPVLLVMHYAVILREEVYLERKFGADYLAYKSKVRRWI
ncbi:MAG: isoprenylcysteine carboxylmethyltransferase family protein [Proteobacteria bacterium]|nr:isoprenylcysteine carboxylmethyltransferase family protein [Pseudomonadota bacterium]